MVKDYDPDVIGWVNLHRGDYDWPYRVAGKNSPVILYKDRDAARKARKRHEGRSIADSAAPVTPAVVAEWGWVLRKKFREK